MSDSTVRSGNEPSLGGNEEQTGQEPSLGGREAQQLRAALELVAMIQLGNSADPPQIDRPKQFENRVVLLTNVINDHVAQQAIAELLVHDRQKPGESIILIIQSAGGAVYPGFAILDVMNSIRSPIITIGTRQVAGIAILPLIAGTKGKRYITPDCPIARTSLYAPGDEAQQPVIGKEVSRLRDLINGTIRKYTFISDEDLSIEGDHYISTKEALRLGFVDYILRAPAQPLTE
jgi:ATP-dependent Clp protease protease subunit